MKLAEAFVEAHVDTSAIPAEAHAAGQQAGDSMAAGVQSGAGKVKKSAQDAGKAIGDAGKQGGKDFAEGTEQGAKKAQSAFGTVMKFVAGGAFLAGIHSTIQAASDLNETISKTGQIFGSEALPQLEQFGAEGVKTMGMSKQATLDAADSFGLLLKNLGFSSQATLEQSQNLTQLAGDFASFFNTRPEDAVTAIAAAFRGETEPIRQFGIFMDDARLKAEALKMGLYDGKGQLDNYAKGQAALAIIMQQSKDAQGDFARTADGAANSQRAMQAEIQNTQAELGKNLLPIYAKVLQVVGELAKGFGNMPPLLQMTVLGFVGLAALAPPILKLVQAAQELGPALATASPYIAAVVAVVGAMAIVFGNAGTIVEDNTETTKKYTDALKQLEGSASAAFGKLRESLLSTDQASQDMAKLGVTVGQVNKALTDGGSGYATFLASVEKTAAGNKDATESFERLRDRMADIRWGEEAAAATQLNQAIATLGQSGVEELVSSTDLSDKALQGLMQAMRDGAVQAGELSLSTKDAATVIDLLGKAMDASKNSAKGAADAQVGLSSKVDVGTESLKKAKSALDLFKQALDLITGGAMTAAAATDAYWKSVDDTTKSVKDNGKTLDEHTEKGRANRSAVRDQAEAILALGDAMVHQGSTTDEAAAAINGHVEELRTQLGQLGLNKDEVDKYIASLGLTPDNVNTAVTLSGQDAAKAELSDWLNKLDGVDKEKKTEIQAEIDHGALSAAQLALDQLTQPRSVRVQLETNIAAILSGLPGPFRHLLGFSTGGLVPGAKGEAQLAVVHGGEYVIDADTVGDIRAGRPSSSDVSHLSTQRAGESLGESGAAPVNVTIQVGDIYGPDEWVDAKINQMQQAAVAALRAGRRS